MATDRVLRPKDSITDLVVGVDISRERLLEAIEIAKKSAEYNPHAYAKLFPQLVDTQTGLLQKSVLEKKYIPEAILKSIEENASLFYGLFDIDNFGDLNEQYGYELGDLVIDSVSNILRTEEKENGHSQEKRTYDEATPIITVGRVGGGEEFGLIFYGFNFEDAYKVMERIRTTIQNTIVESLEDTVNVTVSGGLAEYKAKMDPRSLMKRAGHALKVSKKHGKDQITLY